MATWITAQAAKEKHLKPMGAVTKKGYKPVRWNSMSFPFGPVTDSRKKARADLEAECTIPVWVHGEEIGSDLEGWDYLFDAAATTAHDDPFVFEGEPTAPPSDFLDAATTFEVPPLSDELDELDFEGDETHTDVYRATRTPEVDGEVRELEDYTVVESAPVEKREGEDINGWWSGLDASDVQSVLLTRDPPKHVGLNELSDPDYPLNDFTRGIVTQAGRVVGGLVQELLSTAFPMDTEREDTTDVFDGWNDDDNLATWDRPTDYTFEDPVDTFTYEGPESWANPVERDDLIEYISELEVPKGITLVAHRGEGAAWVWMGTGWYPVSGYAYNESGIERTL